MSEVTEAQTDVAPQGEVETPQAAPEVKADETPTVDSLLSEFDTAVQQADEPSPTPEAPNLDVDAKLNAVYEFQQQQIEERTQADIQSAVGILQESSSHMKDMPPGVVRAYLDDMARNDSRVLQAFKQRNAQPDKWQTILKAAGKEFDKAMPTPKEQKVAEDMDALRAAVHTGDTVAEPSVPSDMHKMSDGEFNQYLEKKFGYSRNWM